MPLPLSADILPSVPSSAARRATHSTGTFEAPLSALTTSRAANPARGDVASEIPVLAAQLCRWDSRLVLLQYADDLVFREPASLHLRLLLDGVQFKPMAFQGQRQRIWAWSRVRRAGHPRFRSQAVICGIPSVNFDLLYQAMVKAGGDWTRSSMPEQLVQALEHSPALLIWLKWCHQAFDNWILRGDFRKVVFE
jgi:hypothetical protein